MNSSSTYLALLGLVQKILNRPGCAISPMARLAEPVPLALPSERPDEHGLHHLLRAGELERLDVQAGLLEVAVLDRREEGQAGRDRPVADADLRRRPARARWPARRARRRTPAHRRAAGGGARAQRLRRDGDGSVDGHGHGSLLVEGGGRSATTRCQAAARRAMRCRRASRRSAVMSAAPAMRLRLAEEALHAAAVGELSVPMPSGAGISATKRAELRSGTPRPRARSPRRRRRTRSRPGLGGTVPGSAKSR